MIDFDFADTLIPDFIGTITSKGSDRDHKCKLLAACSVFGTTKEVRSSVNKAVSYLIDDSKDLFTLCYYLNYYRSGRKPSSFKRLIKKWYLSKDMPFLAKEVCDCPSITINGERWSHADLFKLARINPTKADNPILMSNLARYSIFGVDGFAFSEFERFNTNELRYIYGYEQMESARNGGERNSIINKYNLNIQ